MMCPLCDACEERLDKHGGECVYGGPYSGLRGPYSEAEVRARMLAAYGYDPREVNDAA